MSSGYMASLPRDRLGQWPLSALPRPVASARAGCLASDGDRHSVGPSVPLLFARRPDTPWPPRLLWGTTPLKSLTYLSRAMREAGHVSESAVVGGYRAHGASGLRSFVFSGRSGRACSATSSSSLRRTVPRRALWRYDVFHYFFDGGILRLTPSLGVEFPLLQACGKRIVLLPYGSDAFVYDHITDLSWRRLLMIDYALNGNRARIIEDRLRRWTRRRRCRRGMPGAHRLPAAVGRAAADLLPDRHRLAGADLPRYRGNDQGRPSDQSPRHQGDRVRDRGRAPVAGRRLRHRAAP